MMESPEMKRKKCATESIYYANDNEIQAEVVSSSSMPSQPATNSMLKPSIVIFALNGDCIRKICNYCNFADLYNMCMASDELEIRILQNAVRGRTIKFGELVDCCHILDVFKIFGQSMTKLDIGERDIQYKERKYSKFDEILRLISTYCSTDTIKHLTLQYYQGTTIKKRFLYASIPFFRCIESLTIKESDQHSMEDCINYFESNPDFNSSVNNLVERIVANAINITSLHMHNIKISGRLFYLQHIRNLKTLTLDGCNVRVPDAFLSFLHGNQNLRSLTWNNSSLRGMDTHRSHSSNFVYELVANTMTDLETLHYYPNEGFINDNNKYDGEFLFQLPDYKFLGKFSNLKVLSVPGITIDCLVVLAQRNTVEKLLTCFSQVNNRRDNNVTNFKFVQNFNSLKCIQLFTSFDGRTKIFNKELLSNAHHLIECSLDFFQIDDDIIETTTTSAKNLSILNISFRRGKFTNALYSKLLAIRLKQGSLTSPLAIYIEKKLVTQFFSRLEDNYRPDVVTVRASRLK